MSVQTRHIHVDQPSHWSSSSYHPAHFRWQGSSRLESSLYVVTNARLLASLILSQVGCDVGAPNRFISAASVQNSRGSVICRWSPQAQVASSETLTI